MNNMHRIYKRGIHVRIRHCRMISSNTWRKTIFQNVSEDYATEALWHTPERSPLLSAGSQLFDSAYSSVVSILHHWLIRLSWGVRVIETASSEESVIHIGYKQQDREDPHQGNSIFLEVIKVRRWNIKIGNNFWKKPGRVGKPIEPTTQTRWRELREALQTDQQRKGNMLH